jgi:hypothetical protein
MGESSDENATSLVANEDGIGQVWSGDEIVVEEEVPLSRDGTVAENGYSRPEWPGKNIRIHVRFRKFIGPLLPHPQRKEGVRLIVGIFGLGVAPCKQQNDESEQRR